MRKAHRTGRDVLTVSVRLEERHVQILSYLLDKYGSGSGCSSFSSRFRKMLERLDQRPLEHLQDEPLDPDDALPAEEAQPGEEEPYEPNIQFVDVEL